MAHVHIHADCGSVDRCNSICSLKAANNCDRKSRFLVGLAEDITLSLRQYGYTSKRGDAPVHRRLLAKCLLWSFQRTCGATTLDRTGRIPVHQTLFMRSEAFTYCLCILGVPAWVSLSRLQRSLVGLLLARRKKSLVEQVETCSVRWSETTEASKGPSGACSMQNRSSSSISSSTVPVCTSIVAWLTTWPLSGCRTASTEFEIGARILALPEDWLVRLECGVVMF